MKTYGPRIVSCLTGNLAGPRATLFTMLKKSLLNFYQLSIVALGYPRLKHRSFGFARLKPDYIDVEEVLLRVVVKKAKKERRRVFESGCDMPHPHHQTDAFPLASPEAGADATHTDNSCRQPFLVAATPPPQHSHLIIGYTVHRPCISPTLSFATA